MNTSRTQRGVTWLETCVVLVILGTTSSAALPALGGLIDARRLEGTAVQFATDVQFARSEAVARNQPVRISWYSQPQFTCYVVHTGLSSQCHCADSGAALCSSGAREIKSVNLPSSQGVAITANAGSVLFDPLHGTSTPTATFRLLGRQGRAIHQVINVMGRVRSCTPAGGAAGYPNC